jgi:hypothetical protein
VPHISRLILAAVLFAFLALPGLAPASAGTPATPDDTARFLAGMQPAADSPLAALTSESAWQQHAKFLDDKWAELEKRQLGPIRTWSRANLTDPRQTLLYYFSGPDFLYANAFFPSASTYVLAGLERVGGLPDVTELRRGGLSSELSGIRASLGQVLHLGYFITMDMGRHLNRGQLNGTMPVLYVFLARSGQTIRGVTFFNLNLDGSMTPASDKNARAVKIDFTGPDGRNRTLYYFSTDLANKGARSSGLLKFCETLGPSDAFIKSASYLLHGSNFSDVRDFLMARSTTMLQDDTGVPVIFFKPEQWELQPFGVYNGPIAMFRGNYQSKLKSLFQTGKPTPIEFGIGYKWRVHTSNLLRATKKDAKAELAR